MRSADPLEVPKKTLKAFGWRSLVASTGADSAQFQELLRELREDPGVHSWKWMPINGGADLLRQVRRFEERLRPTTIFFYHGVCDDGSRELVGVGTVSVKIRRSFPFPGFPVVGRCFIRAGFRGRHLYTCLLNHRLGICFKKWRRRLKAVHLGTASKNIISLLEVRRRRGEKFLCIGRETLGRSGDRHEVKDFLYLTPAYARRLLATAEARGSTALKERIRTFVERGFGASGPRRLKNLLGSLRARTGRSLPRRGSALAQLIAFCDAVPVASAGGRRPSRAKFMSACACAALFAFGSPAAADPSGGGSCLASTTPESLLRDPADPRLYDYAACSELTTGRTDLCDAFPGGPLSSAKPLRGQTIVRADGSLGRETLYGVCVSRAAAYRLLALLASGAPDAEMIPQMRLLLYGEDIPAAEVLRAYVEVYRNGRLDGTSRPDLARIGFFNHVLGKEACRKVELNHLRRECRRKAAALEAFRAKDPGLCLEGDFLCRALLLGPEVCRRIGDPIVRDHCEKRNGIQKVPTNPPPARLERPTT